MSENARTAQAGFRKLAHDVGVPLVGDTLEREAGETPRVDPEDEEQLASDAAEAAAASASNVPLDTLVSRFKQDRLYEE
jgi:hypothetical protein